MQTFTFKKVQFGSWGETDLGTILTVKAKTLDAAIAKIEKRIDHNKRLPNGDRTRWILQ